MNVISKILQTGAYLWAGVILLSVPILFIGGSYWSHNLAKLPFMKIHPRYSGGPIVETTQVNEVEYRLHQPVFEGLWNDREKGFVQIEIIGNKSTENELTCPIDYDRDGKTDVLLKLKTQTDSAPALTPLSPNVKGLGKWAKTREGWIVRIELIK
jgi:hypothetical protein